jgi:dihydroorotase
LGKIVLISKVIYEEGSIASLSLFQKERGVLLKRLSYQIQNSVFLGTETKGKVHGIVNQGKLILA